MTEKEEKSKTKRSTKYRWLRRLGRIFLGILVFLVLLVLFIRSPWGQSIIVDQAVSYVKDKTGTEVSVDKLYVTFDGNIQLDGLYIEDKAGDTLIYSKSLEASLPLGTIIKGNGYELEYANWDGFTARISRKDTMSGFNYQFLVDAFATNDTTSTSQPFRLDVGELNFTNFDVTFDDAVNQLDASVKFETFHLTMNQLDLEKMIVDIDAIELTNAVVSYDKDTVTAFAKAEPDSNPNQDTTIAEAITDDANDSPLPLIKVGNFKLKDVALNYESAVDGIDIGSYIGLFETSIPKADVQNSIYKIDYVRLQDSEANIAMKTIGPVEPYVFEWPDLEFEASSIDINNSNVLYTLDDAKVQRGYFNPDAIQASNVDLVSTNLEYSDSSGNVNILELSGEEGSGIDVHQLQATVAISDQQIQVADLNLQVNTSRIQGDAALGYESMMSLIENPTNFSVQAALPSYSIDLAEIFKFQPNLRSNAYLSTLSKRNITGSLRVNGSTSYLEIPNLVANWGNETAVLASGTVRNAMNVDQLQIDFPSVKMRSVRRDVIQFVDEEDLGINLPERFSLNGSIAGSLEDIQTNLILTSSKGNVELKGSFSNRDLITFDARMQAQEFDIGSILGNPQLGKLNLDVNAKGSGSSLNTLDATVDAYINSFTYNDYEIKNLPINASIKNGRGEVTSTYRDENIDVNLRSQVQLDSIASQANVKLDIAGVDLRAFGITNQNVRAAGKIDAYFKGDAQNYTATAQIDEGIAVFDNQSYLLGDLNLKAFVKPDTTSLDVSNKMLDLRLRSNTDPIELTNALQRHINRYLTDQVSMDTIQPVVMNIKGNIRPAPILRDVILPQLEALDTIQISVDFNEMQRKLDADIKAPYIRYAGSEIDSLFITSRSDSTNLNFDIGFKDLESGPLHINKTNLNGKVAQNQLVLDFISYHEEEKLMHLGSSLSRKRDPDGIDNLIMKMRVQDFILNKKPWTIPENNTITFGENRLRFADFNLVNGNQRIELRSDLPNVEKPHLGILFNEFRLQALLSFLNPEEKLATGRLNGELVLEDVFNKFGFSAALNIDDLALLEVPLGRLQLDAGLVDGDLYEMEMAINGPNVDLSMTGDYQATVDDALLNLTMDIDKLSMETVTALSGDYLSAGSGAIAGEVKIGGTLANPEYDGVLNFDRTSFNVNMLNAVFTLPDERLKFDNNGVYFTDFSIADASNNTIVANGEIGLENLLNPTFDLKMRAKNFTALNSTAADNDLYYGTANFDANARITGDLIVPVVDLRLVVNKQTNVTYVMPPTELDIVQREGIVQFVNKENPDDILTQTEEESATLTGYDITADFIIKDGATVNIIVDPTTGDNLQVEGSGDLKFRMTPNGRMTLAGRYEINDGFYELNLYDLVTRKFNIARGSSVSWSGDPFDANLDVSAIYDIETSASALMASQTSGADLQDAGRFRQVLPFLVYLNVDGELMQPEISFRLDMPEDEQGAIGGQVYGRVQQLNSQDQELNKQVFSLLVLNRFFPTSGADGSSGGTATIARDNLNQALSDQLNQFGGKLLGDSGVDLTFGLDSYTDYQGSSPQERTQLDVTASKKLLDERLIVSVGSEVDLEGSPADGDGQTPVIGNVSLEYLITEGGQWRLKGFRKNQYDNVIDGQLIISGIGVIFTKEFNEFKNLFAKTVKEESQKARKEEEEEENVPKKTNVENTKQ